MAAKIPPLVLLIVLVLIIITTIVVTGYRAKCLTLRETFTSDTQLTFCPLDSNTYMDKSGDTYCCDGQVEGNVCMGKPLCALSNKSSLPSCTQVLTDYYKIKSGQICPTTMPNYYENEHGIPVGCTAAPLAPTMTQPQSSLSNTSPSCTIYASQSDNQANQNSCFNQQQLAATPCFGIGCTKSIQIQPSVGVGIVTVDFGDTDGHRHTCYTSDSYAAYLNKTKPNWQSTFDLTKSIKICDVAQAVFVDRTMSIQNTQS